MSRHNRQTATIPNYIILLLLLPTMKSKAHRGERHGNTIRAQ